MKWFKKAVSKQETIYYDLYFLIEKHIDHDRYVTLDRVSLSSKTFHVNNLKHTRVPLVIFEH